MFDKGILSVHPQFIMIQPKEFNHVFKVECEIVREKDFGVWFREISRKITAECLSAESIIDLRHPFTYGLTN
jgi:hypothetical protein